MTPVRIDVFVEWYLGPGVDVYLSTGPAWVGRAPKKGESPKKPTEAGSGVPNYARCKGSNLTRSPVALGQVAVGGTRVRNAYVVRPERWW